MYMHKHKHTWTICPEPGSSSGNSSRKTGPANLSGISVFRTVHDPSSLLSTSDARFRGNIVGDPGGPDSRMGERKRGSERTSGYLADGREGRKYERRWYRPRGGEHAGCAHVEQVRELVCRYFRDIRCCRSRTMSFSPRTCKWGVEVGLGRGPLLRIRESKGPNAEAFLACAQAGSRSLEILPAGSMQAWSNSPGGKALAGEARACSSLIRLGI